LIDGWEQARGDRRPRHLEDQVPGAEDQLGAGHKKNKLLHLPPISQLKTRMRQVVWQDPVEDVVKHTYEKPVIRRLEKLLAA
jgi:hypothetical protein